MKGTRSKSAGGNTTNEIMHDGSIQKMRTKREMKIALVETVCDNAVDKRKNNYPLLKMSVRRKMNTLSNRRGLGNTIETLDATVWSRQHGSIK